MHYRNHSHAHRRAWGKHNAQYKQFHGCGAGQHNKHFAHGFSKGRFSAPVNIEEQAGSYELYLFAPGLSKVDFNISVTDDLLTIGYKTPDLVPDESENWLHKEYRRRSFERSFVLNEKVDTENISAKYEQGVLLVTLPKLPGMESTKQDILVD
jgi:HSP20 family protein